MENPLILLTAIKRRLDYKSEGIFNEIGPTKATATTEINLFEERTHFTVYVRLGGTQILNSNVYCGRLQHRVVMDIVTPKASPKRLDNLYEIYSDIANDFGCWGNYIGYIAYKGKVGEKTFELRTSTQEVEEGWTETFYELASSYLENDGTFALPTNTGAGLSVSFLVDETVSEE